MKYDILPELKKYSGIHLPMNPAVLKMANAMMPVVQRGRSVYQGELKREQMDLPYCTADLISPTRQAPHCAMLYCHGGGFVMQAAAYHKNLVQRYAAEANCAVMFPDYRLAPEHRFPAQIEDCWHAYQRMLAAFPDAKILIGGDSAGACLAAALVILAHRLKARMPDGLMLVYPVLDSRLVTESMKRYTDTPLWDSRSNEKMWSFYVDSKHRQSPLVSPMAAGDLRYFPPVYLETARYDCLHDEGILFADRLEQQGIDVMMNETQGTFHGYDIAEDTAYVQEQVIKRLTFLKTF